MKNDKFFGNYDEEKKIVLLISDNMPDLRRIEKEFLEASSVNCLLYRSTTISGALEQLGRVNLKIDIVIYDLRLKDASVPLDQYKELEKDGDGVPIILLTGDEEDDIASAKPLLEAGAFGHTHRSEFRMLVQLIRKVIYRETRV